MIDRRDDSAVSGEGQASRADNVVALPTEASLPPETTGRQPVDGQRRAVADPGPFTGGDGHGGDVFDLDAGADQARRRYESTGCARNPAQGVDLGGT